MTVYAFSPSDFAKWLPSLENRSVFVPQTAGIGAWVSRLSDQTPLPALDKPRAAQSAKGFFTPAAEAVARYGPAGAQTPGSPSGEIVLVGVRACELKAWRYLDKVMLGGDFIDPLYKSRRERIILVSCDCVACAESCCCNLVDGRPFVKEGDGADINVTALPDIWLVEPMSARGRGMLATGTREANSEELSRRDAVLQAVSEQLRKQNEKFTYSATDNSPPKLPEGDDEAWQRHAADCVECGACTNVCPTCHCFYLFDHSVGEKHRGQSLISANRKGAEISDSPHERVRTWDSCLLATYHRMAGGPAMKLTPRPELRSRLANRILHKFVYSPQQYHMLGCVGCGRCIDACLGAIDIRTVVEDLKR